MPKVSPSRQAERTMTEVKYVDAFPSRGRRLLPNDNTRALYLTGDAFTLVLRNPLQQCAAQEDEANAEIDHQTGHVYQCGHEGCRRRGGVEPRTTQQKRQHGTR